MKRYTVRVVTNASKNSVSQVSDQDLRVRLMAKPIDGQANKMLTSVLALHFAVKASQIRIVTGERAKVKIVEVG